MNSRGKESIKSRSGGILWCIFPKVGWFLSYSTHRIVGKGWVAFAFCICFFIHRVVGIGVCISYVAYCILHIA